MGGGADEGGDVFVHKASVTDVAALSTEWGLRNGTAGSHGAQRLAMVALRFAHVSDRAPSIHRRIACVEDRRLERAVRWFALLPPPARWPCPSHSAG